MKVKTRFAPSPTGYLHVGGVRTALYSWLYARHQQGRFFLRIEDTDLERSSKQAVDVIFDGMHWLGLTWDETPVFQTQRFERYHSLLNMLITQGKAYRCDCPTERLEKLRAQQIEAGEKPRYDGRCRYRQDVDPDKPHVVRFKTPQDGEVSFTDLVRGAITIANTELDDLIIRRTDGSPTYNFCVVVDDADMQITHVVRGEDHINNTPRQIHLYRALDAQIPTFAHVGMILGDDGTKLSKRHGAVSVTQYRDEGYLPQALLNYLVRLGWAHGDQEIFSVQEMIALFDLQSVSKSASVFDTTKLRWLNQHYMRTLPTVQIAKACEVHFQSAGLNINQGPDIQAVLPLYVERVHTLVELVQDCRYLYEAQPTYDPLAVQKHLIGSDEVLQALSLSFAELDNWDAQAIQSAIKMIAKTLNIGMGKVGMPLRVALTGRLQSPAINELVMLLGREKTLLRLQQAQQIAKDVCLQEKSGI